MNRRVFLIGSATAGALGRARAAAAAEGSPPVRVSDTATPLTVEVIPKTPEG